MAVQSHTDKKQRQAFASRLLDRQFERDYEDKAALITSLEKKVKDLTKEMKEQREKNSADKESKQYEKSLKQEKNKVSKLETELLTEISSKASIQSQLDKQRTESAKLEEVNAELIKKLSIREEDLKAQLLDEVEKETMILREDIVKEKEKIAKLEELLSHSKKQKESKESSDDTSKSQSGYFTKSAMDAMLEDCLATISKDIAKALKLDKIPGKEPPFVKETLKELMNVVNTQLKVLMEVEVAKHLEEIKQLKESHEKQMNDKELVIKVVTKKLDEVQSSADSTDKELVRYKEKVESLEKRIQELVDRVELVRTKDHTNNFTTIGSASALAPTPSPSPSMIAVRSKASSSNSDFAVIKLTKTISQLTQELAVLRKEHTTMLVNMSGEF